VEPDSDITSWTLEESITGQHVRVCCDCLSGNLVPVSKLGLPFKLQTDIPLSAFSVWICDVCCFHFSCLALVH
jgi:hypothetical protein